MNIPASVRQGVLAGGNWIIDHVKVIDSWPPQDALASILSQSSSNGGAPYNVLKNLARLGAPFPLSAVGLVGDDDNGRAILADCAAQRIDTRALRIQPGAATSYTDVMTVRDTGRRTFFHQRGVNARLGPEHFDFSTTPAAIFHLGYLLLLDRLDSRGDDGLPRSAAVLRRASEAGLRTSVDLVSEYSNRFGSVVGPVLQWVNVLFANDFESERLTGIPLRSAGALRPDAVHDAARALVDAGVREWVIIHAPEGVCARSAAGEAFWQPAVPLPAGDIAGAAGAGDALAAGVLWGLHDRRPMAECLYWGVCVAAASLLDSTCSGGIKPLAECLALGERSGSCRQPKLRP